MKGETPKGKSSLNNSVSWLKIYRKFLDWEWYDDINTKVLFLHILLKANYKDKKWRGEIIPRGSFVTSIGILSKETHLSTMQTRTSLTKLKSTSEITSKSTSQFTLITVVKYDEYQGSKQECKNKITNGITNEQQTDNKPITTTIECIERIEGVETLQVGNKDLKTILEIYNQTFNKSISSVKGFEKNYLYWKDTYPLETITKAIENASLDKFWKDKMTLTILFRQKNTNGEPVDYIGDLANRTPSRSGGIGII